VKELLNIHENLREFQNWFEPYVQARVQNLPENDYGQIKIKKAISHSLLGGGKRIRAFIIAQSCEIYGIPKESVIHLLLAIEMVHCYSLIHDDLPCMDNSDIRRGKKSLHKEFDEATALLTGNSLMSMAFDEILSSKFEVENYVKISLLKHLSRAIGYFGMMSGQMLDIIIVNERTAKTEEFVHMNKLKTGELFAFCMASGAILKQNIDDYKTLSHIGYDIGYIFQIADDITDITQEPNSHESFAKKEFINHLGGTDEAKRHLEVISSQVKSAIAKFSDTGTMNSLIDYIILQ
jgi:farnesyl diphosphate synthase